MLDKQTQTLLKRKAEEPNGKVSRSIAEFSQKSVKFQQKENQENESELSSDIMSKQEG